MHGHVPCSRDLRSDVSVGDEGHGSLVCGELPADNHNFVCLSGGMLQPLSDVITSLRCSSNHHPAAPSAPALSGS